MNFKADCVLTIDGHDGPVNCVVVLLDGSLASGGDVRRSRTSSSFVETIEVDTTGVPSLGMPSLSDTRGPSTPSVPSRDCTLLYALSDLC